jgi:hypothetical protein
VRQKGLTDVGIDRPRSQMCLSTPSGEGGVTHVVAETEIGPSRVGKKKGRPMEHLQFTNRTSGGVSQQRNGMPRDKSKSYG